MTARLLREDETDQAASLLARALDADPPARYMFLDPARRPRLFALQFAAIIRNALVHGAVYTTPDELRGVVVWLAPGQTDATDERLARAGFDAALAACDDDERHRCGRFFERMDLLYHSTAHEPHSYLFLIGVDPPHQGTGVGTALMQPVLVRAEREAVHRHFPRWVERGIFDRIWATLQEACSSSRAPCSGSAAIIPSPARDDPEASSVVRGTVMASDLAVRPLLSDEIDAAATMLARAFADDPLPTLLAPDRDRRDVAARWLFAALARYGMRFGEVWTTGALEGAAIWWAPEYVDSNEERAALVGLADGGNVLGAEAWRRFQEFGALTGRIHHESVPGPHWYLNVLGVAPESQGKGVGSALLASMFSRLDREHLPAYLDTGTAENVAYYGRRGFVLTAEVADPVSGILIRGMRRDPR